MHLITWDISCLYNRRAHSPKSRFSHDLGGIWNSEEEHSSGLVGKGVGEKDCFGILPLMEVSLLKILPISYLLTEVLWHRLNYFYILKTMIH